MQTMEWNTTISIGLKKIKQIIFELSQHIERVTWRHVFYSFYNNLNFTETNTGLQILLRLTLLFSALKI